MDALVWVLLSLFCHIKSFSYKTIHEEYFPTKDDNYLAVHEKPEHIAIFTPTVPHGWFLYINIKNVFFLLIDRAVCMIQNNQLLDVLIKCIAKYHILYSGQLEICLSVHVLVIMYVHTMWL